MRFNIPKMFQGVDAKWIEIFTSSTMMPLLTKILKELSSDMENITPTPNDIFNFARLTPYGQIKVVILGQDPYPKKGDAHGLSFSCKGAIPGSLHNIYKCLIKQKQISEIPKTADLTQWAKQGVLLLNVSLTTRVESSNAHVKIWSEFTDELVRLISHDCKCGPGDYPIFMLWGKFAQKKKPIINEDCIIYEWLHPSPLAQASAPPDETFVNCNHFTKANIMLEEMKVTPIDWDPVLRYVVYTDGACSNNGKGVLANAAYSAYFAKGPLKGTVKYGKVPIAVINGETIYGSNQRAEGLGIITAFESIPEGSDTTLVVDTNFWKQMIEDYMPNWVLTGVDFNTKKNPDITIKLFNLITAMKQTGTINIIHVRSHGKDKEALAEHIEGNRIADIYAVKGKLLKNFVQRTCKATV